MRRATMADPLAADRTREDYSLAGPVALYLALFALMTSPWLAGFVSIPWDSKAHFLPQIQFLAQSLWHGEWPWWNPFVFSGIPQVADPQSMIFSPPYLLLALVDPAPGPWAQDVTQIAAMAAGGVGLLFWFRDRGWHWAGGVIAALVFSFGAAMAWRIQHTGQVLSLAYLPWALLFLDRALDRGSVWAGFGSGLVAAFIVLGRDQVALLCIYLLAARAIVTIAFAPDRLAQIKTSLLPLLIGGLAGALTIAVPVAMTVLLAQESNRPVIDFAGAGAGSLHPAHLVTLVVPQLFGAAGDMADYWGPPSFAWVGTGLFTAQNVGQSYLGALPLLVIASAAATGRLFDREIAFFSAAFIFVSLYALGWYTPTFRAMYAILPGVNLYRRPADAVFLIGGIGAILAGYGIHCWFRAPWQRPTRGIIQVAIIVSAVALLASLMFALQIGRLARVPLPLTIAALSFGLAVAAIAFAGPRIALQPWHAAIALAAVTAMDLGSNNGPSSSSALPAKTFDVLEPDTRDPVISALKQRIVADGTRRDRIELAGLGFHWPNASMTHRLENTLGYNPVRLGLYSRATGAEDHVGLPDQRKFSALMPSYRCRLADLLGLRWIASPVPITAIDPSLKDGDLILTGRPGGAYLYENPNAMPRVMFATRARAADFDDILATGRWPDFDPATTVLLTNPPRAGADRRPGAARLVRYEQTRIEIDVDAPDGGYVVLGDVWHPWWRATINGKPAAIDRANVIFRGVDVPPGKHRVEMTFRPLAGLIEALAQTSRGRPISDRIRGEGQPN